MTDHRYIRAIGPTLLAALLAVVPVQTESQESTVPPEILNRSEVQAALMRDYPADLRGTGVGGRVVLWLYVSETGQNLDSRIAQSSGHEQLDQAALRIVAGVMRFGPALGRRQVENPGPISHPVIHYEQVPVAAWIEIPIAFVGPGA